MRGYLDMGYSVVKMKIGGASLAEDLRRIEAVIEVDGSGQALAVDANGRFDLATAIAYAEALEPYGLRWYEEAGDPLDFALQAELASHYDRPMATGENLFSMQDARNLIRYGGMRPDRDCPPVRLRALLWTGRVPAHARDAGGARLVGAARHPPRRSSDVAQHGGRSRPRRKRILPRHLPAVRRICGWNRRSRRSGALAGHPRHWLRSEGRVDCADADSRRVTNSDASCMD